MLILASVCALADQTQIYSKIYLNPFYRDSTTSGAASSYSLLVNPPDKVTEVYNAMVSFQMYMNPAVTFTLLVNGQACNNPTYTISTTYSGASQAVISFDCSNRIKQAGLYNVTLTANKNTGAITGWLDLVYSNKPTADMTIHGTEYVGGQTAKVWLQLLNASNQALTQATCYVDIYTPNNALYLSKATMNKGSDGIYFYNLPVPLLEGVYPVIATCYYVATQTLNTAVNITMVSGSLDSGSISNTLVEDGSYMTTSETPTPSSPRRYTADVSFNNTMCNISSSLLTGITVSLTARWNSNVVNDNILISIYNYTSQTWLPLPNVLAGVGTGPKTAVNSLSFSNITTAGLYNATSKETKLRFNDTSLADTATTGLDYDFVGIYCDQLGSPQWQQVKGSSEIHVTQNPIEERFETNTLCGNEQIGCAEFRYDEGINNQSQGYIFENLTFINTQQTTIDSYHDYITPMGVDCTALLDIVKVNSTGSFSIVDDSIFKAGDKENCIITVPVQFVPSDYSFNVEIYLDNYMGWEVRRDKDLEHYFEVIVTPFCDEMANISNAVYEIPVTTNLTQFSNNPILHKCNWVMDDLYWFNYYYNSSLSVASSGDYESYLIEIRYYHDEIQGHAQIIQDIKADFKSSLYTLNTLCDRMDANYECAKIMPPDTYFGSQEGYVIENITLTNTFNSYLETSFEYETASATDCTAVNDIFEVRNGTSIQIKQLVIMKVGTRDNCVLTIPVRFNEGETSSNIEIYIQNYPLWDIQWAKDLVNNLNNTISPYCLQVATDANITYSLPINASIDAYISNPELFSCYRSMDDLYWWYYYYDTMVSSNFTQIGQLESIHYESEFFWIRIRDDYDEVATFKRNANQLLMLNILQTLNSTQGDLNLYVIAPTRCLQGTNWILRATVRDRVGQIMSPYDGVSCNITTSLWGASDMTYEWALQDFKYIHTCDIDGTFQWSVDCVR